MKNLRVHFKTRLMALTLTIVMVLSMCSMPFSIMATEAELPDAIPPSSTAPSTPGTGDSSIISFEDGIYTLSISAEALTDILQSRSITKEDLLRIAPEELVDIALGDGSYSEKAKALARTYLAMAIESEYGLESLFPLEATMAYFLQKVNPETGKPIIWDIVSMEDLMSAVDVVALFDVIAESGRLEEIVDAAEIAQILSDEGKITESVITDLLDNLKVNNPAAYDELIDMVAEIIFNNPEFDYILNEVIDMVINDADAFDALMGLINSDELADLVTDDDQALLDFYNGLSDEQKQALSDRVNYDNLQSYLGGLSTGELKNIIDAALIYTLIEDGYIDLSAYADSIFTSEFIDAYEDILIGGDFLTSHASEIVDDAFISAYASVIITKTFIDAHAGLISAETLTGFIDSDFISSNKDTLRGVFTKMIEDGIVDINEEAAKDLFTADELQAIADSKGVLVSELSKDDLKDALLSADYSEKLTSYINDHITDFNSIPAAQVYEYIQDDDAAYDLLLDKLMSDSDAVGDVLKDITNGSNTTVINDLFDAIKNNDDAYNAIIENIKGNSTLIDTIFENVTNSTDPRRDALIEEMTAKIDKEQIISVLIDHINELQENGTVDVVEIIQKIGFTTLLDEQIITVNDVIQVVGSDYIVSSGIVKIEDVIDAVGGVSALVSENIIDMQSVIDSITNMNAIIAHLDMGEVIRICGIQTLIDVIGMQNILETEGVMDTIQIDRLLTVVPINTLLSYIDINTLVAKVDKKEAVAKVINYLITFTDSISFNGTEIYTFYDGFNMEAAFKALIDAIPTPEKLSDLSDPTVLSFKLTWKLDAAQLELDIPGLTLTKDEYSYGFEVKLFGDTTELERMFAKLASYIQVNTDGTSTSVVINAPAKVTALYLKALNSDKLPAALRDKLLAIGIQNASEETANAILARLTVDELIQVLEAIDFDRVDLVELAESKRALLERGREYLLRVVKKVYTFIDEDKQNLTLSDFYGGNGSFGPVSAGATIDIKDMVTRALTGRVPANILNQILLVLNDTVISHTLHVTVNFQNLYEAKFVSPTGETLLTTYLPAGLDMADVYALDILRDYSDFYWTHDGSDVATLKMPEQDCIFTVAHTSHNYEIVEEVAPTCTKDGYILYRCPICLDEYKETLPTLGHKWVEIERVKPTIEKEGYVLYKCSVCGETRKEILPKLVPTQQNLVDYTTGVTVEGLFTDGATVKVKVMEYDTEIWENKISADSTIIIVYEITVENGYYQGPLKISLAVDSQYEGRDLKVYHKIASGNIEDFDVTIREGVATITVNSLSPFAVVEEPEPETEPVTEPETEPVTEPVTEPETEPETEPVTEPVTEPETEPETEPGETEPGETEPGETEPGETEPGETEPGETEPGETEPGETEPGETEPVPPNKKSRIWIWIIIVVVILLIALAVLLLILKKKNGGDDGNDNNEAGPTEPVDSPEDESVEEASEEVTEEISEEVAEETTEETSEETSEEVAEEATEEVPQPVEIPVITPVEGPIDAEKADEILTNEEAATVIVATADHVERTGLKVSINIGSINGQFDAGDTVDIEALKEKKLISPKAQRIKILANGVIDKPLHFVADDFSIQAVKMIVLTGGTVVKL